MARPGGQGSGSLRTGLRKLPDSPASNDTQTQTRQGTLTNQIRPPAALLAQSVERETLNLKVAGSTPA
ncbi:hypothetical protein BDP55DRAFT_218563 [Colletotrichum godetiae]|uniref:Uncharacterized protein n=1 Tax=Colletotrichum godetiae TaxID=1209918 RepID=A0AAJ0EVS2_9PEZI|nr:uncharacterized protein BDP55DRAFT_218563 [Colletotrichum godetiae]KAK1673525.1 hypothetical protein BDP55DRAFT_218563 [Colletotrichum godetiae]